jgi:hypothetical protein
MNILAGSCSLPTVVTIYYIFRRIVRNYATRVDPPDVYNWRILALAAAVSAIA